MLKKNNSKDWIIKSDGAYQQSSFLLKNGFKHAFYTKKSIGKIPQELIKMISNESSIHILNQVHSNKVVEASKSIKYPWPKADSIISSNRKNQSLWVYSADCIPLLFANPKTGQAAAVHAGWKGISKNIINKTIKKLECFGSNRKDLIIAIGPSITLSNYQVEIEVALSVYKSLQYNKKNNKNPKDYLKGMKELGLIIPEEEKGKFLLDLRYSAIKQLQIERIRDSQITINPYCSFKNDELFHSWRRDKIKSSNWSCIISN